MSDFTEVSPRLDVTLNARRIAFLLLCFSVFYAIADFLCGMRNVGLATLSSSGFYLYFLKRIDKKGVAPPWVRVGIISIAVSAIGATAQMLKDAQAVLIWLWPLGIATGYLFDREERAELGFLLVFQVCVLFSSWIFPAIHFFEKTDFHPALSALMIQGSLVATFLLAWTSRRAWLQSIHEIEKKNLDLIHSAKMSMLGRVTAGICHEIKNPLAVVVGKTNSLLVKATHGNGKSMPDRETLARELGRVAEAADRISRTVSATQNFSRTVDHDDMIEVPLARLFADVTEICHDRLACAKVVVRTRCLPPSATLKCRAAQMEQVLLNLVVNAIDAVEGLPDKNQRWVELAAEERPDTGEIRITVTDGGSGIPKDVAFRILEPFFTTKSPGKGTGLGLSISDDIVKKHGGSLEYDASHPNTRFAIHLPAVVAGGGVSR